MRGLVVDFEHAGSRFVQDVLAEATAVYWLRRAKAFEDAAPRPGDFHGKAGADELRDRSRRCMAAAEACRHHAGLVGVRGQDIEPDIFDALAEVAA